MKRLLVAIAGLGVAGFVYATPTACTSGTSLFNLVAGATGTVYDAQNNTFPTSPAPSFPADGNGFACTMDGYTFSNFQMVINSANDVGTDIEISMSTVNAATGQITFGTDLTEGQDIQFEYEITGGVTNMTLQNGGSGNATITELICSSAVLVTGDGTNCGGTSDPPELAMLAAGAGASDSSAVGANAQDWVFKDINGGNTATSGLSEFSQQIVPEPMTLSLLGAGLLGLGLVRRKFKQ
jgi:hypothetical protein